MIRLFDKCESFKFGLLLNVWSEEFVLNAYKITICVCVQSLRHETCLKGSEGFLNLTKFISLIGFVISRLRSIHHWKKIVKLRNVKVLLD